MLTSLAPSQLQDDESRLSALDADKDINLTWNRWDIDQIRELNRIVGKGWQERDLVRLHAFVGGNPSAAYINDVLSENSARLGQMYATTHPRDPNYLAVTGGFTFGWTRDLTLGTDRVDVNNLGDALDAAGRTWKAYAEGMRGTCDTTTHDTASGGYYQPDSDPFMRFADVVSDPLRCATHNDPLSAFPFDLESKTTTPAFVWLSPNSADAMGDTGVAAGDAWLARILPQIFASPAWTTSRSLLIVSWADGFTDEFGPGYPNHIPTYVAASQGLVKVNYSSPIRYTDYSLAATIEHALGIAPLTSNDRYALPYNDIWTSPGPRSGSAPGGDL